MRVVSFVPSWTETLLWAGVSVIGRTRFCLHPDKQTSAIPIVGGTKDAHWDKVKDLKPDLVLFDREENTKSMAENCPLPWHATHVVCMRDLPTQLEELGKLFSNCQLFKLSQRWNRVIEHRFTPDKQIPGFLHWHKPPVHTQYDRVVYVIWAHPWMAAGPYTFIGSMCQWLGWELWPALEEQSLDKYPRWSPKDFPPGSKTLFLCSSEPYPFLKKTKELDELPGDVALVNGESLSWFGLRSLHYLEQKIPNL